MTLKFRIVYLLSLLFMLMGLWGCTEKNGQVDERPNIILILADDMGYSDLGCMGSGISTPNLDRLAANGILCTQAYNAGRCCPTRASLLTGLYPHQAGVGQMTGDLGHPSYRGYLNQKCATLGELMQGTGYATMMSGKWHLGDKQGQRPNQRGFDRFFGTPEGGGIYFFPFRKKRSIMLDEQHADLDSANFYTTQAFSDHAVRFVNEHRDTSQKPFFMYLAHIAPHFPLQVPDSALEPYLGQFEKGFDHYRSVRYKKMAELGLLPKNSRLSEPDGMVEEWDKLSEEEQSCFARRMAVYAAQLSFMDEGIGRLIKTLEDQNILDNTLILFLSDNGATHERLQQTSDCDLIGGRELNVSVSRSWANVSNTPYRMYKHWVHEGGIRTPLIVHYPNKFGEGRLESQPLHITDIVPSCLALAGGTYPENLTPLNGRNLLPMWEGKAIEQPEFWAWEHMGNKAVRKGNLKLVSKYKQSHWELYDLEKDPSELNDLATTFPDKVNELEGIYDEWAKKTGVVPWETITPYDKSKKK